MIITYSAFRGIHMHTAHLHAVSDMGVVLVVVNVAFLADNLHLFESKIDKTIDRCMNNNNNRKAGGKMFSLGF